MKLSIAYPMLALSYAIIPLAARIIFDEQISLTRWIGIAVVCAGVFIIWKG
jgi:multidrug transporter EmrE-like cation transporter